MTRAVARRWVSGPRNSVGLPTGFGLAARAFPGVRPGRHRRRNGHRHVSGRAGRRARGGGRLAACRGGLGGTRAAGGWGRGRGGGEAVNFTGGEGTWRGLGADSEGARRECRARWRSRSRPPASGHRHRHRHRSGDECGGREQCGTAAVAGGRGESARLGGGVVGHLRPRLRLLGRRPLFPRGGTRGLVRHVHGGGLLLPLACPVGQDPPVVGLDEFLGGHLRGVLRGYGVAVAVAVQRRRTHVQPLREHAVVERLKVLQLLYQHRELGRLLRPWHPSRFP